MSKPKEPVDNGRQNLGRARQYIIKYMDDLSDEEVCRRFAENPYYQYFCGEVFFRDDLPLDCSSMTRWW